MCVYVDPRDELNFIHNIEKEKACECLILFAASFGFCNWCVLIGFNKRP